VLSRKTPGGEIPALLPALIFEGQPRLGKRSDYHVAGEETKRSLVSLGHGGEKNWFTFVKARYWIGRTLEDRGEPGGKTYEAEGGTSMGSPRICRSS